MTDRDADRLAEIVEDIAGYQGHVVDDAYAWDLRRREMKRDLRERLFFPKPQVLSDAAKARRLVWHRQHYAERKGRTEAETKACARCGAAFVIPPAGERRGRLPKFCGRKCANHGAKK